MHCGRDEVNLDLLAERFEQIARCTALVVCIKICESLYAQGISAIRPDPGA